MRKILKRDLIIPRGVYLDDNEDRSKFTPLQMALDNYLRQLPDEEFLNEDLTGRFNNGG